MSERQASTYQVYENLRNRICEIMDEKGGAYSQRALAKRIGMSKDTLRRILIGERPIIKSDLEKIAIGLHLSVERIKQTDMDGVLSELHLLLKTKKDPQRAISLAEKYNYVAIGITEKCDALNLLARAYFAVEEYNKAHELWLQAYDYSVMMSEKSGDTEQMYIIMKNLLTTHTIRKEFSIITDLLNKVEQYFKNDHEKSGAVCYSKAILAEQIGDKVQAHNYFIESMGHYLKTDSLRAVGRAEFNIGYFLFKTGRYQESLDIIEQAIPKLVDDAHGCLTVTKVKVQLLLKLGQKENAIHLLENSITQSKLYPQLHAKFLLLYAVATENPTFAKEVFLIPNCGNGIYKLACKFLTNHYIDTGDLSSAVNYYKKSEKFAPDSFDFLHEEDL